MHNRHFVIALCLAAVVLLGASQVHRSSEPIANSNLIDCTTDSDHSERIECYEDVLAALSRQSTDKQAVTALENSIAASPLLATECHIALHPLGEQAGRQLIAAGKHVPVVTPDSFCHEGYVHGMQIAVLEDSSARQLVREAGNLCGAATPSASWSCLHSVGHALHKRSNENLAVAIERCDSAATASMHGQWSMPLGTAAFVASCAKGAMMEHYLVRPESEVSTVCSDTPARLKIHCESYLAMAASSQGITLPNQWQACTTLTLASTSRRACIATWARQDIPATACDALDASEDQAVCRSQAPVRSSYDISRIRAKS